MVSKSPVTHSTHSSSSCILMCFLVNMVLVFKWSTKTSQVKNLILGIHLEAHITLDVVCLYDIIDMGVKVLR
jgi:hypothetical protein